MHDIESLTTCSFKISARGIRLDPPITLIYVPRYALFGACEKGACSDRLQHGDFINL